MERSRYFHTELLWNFCVWNFSCGTSRYFHTELFVRNFRVELSRYFHTELLCKTFVRNFSCGIFTVLPHGTFVYRTFCRELSV